MVLTAADQRELDTLLEAIDQRYGFNFKTYSKRSLLRRIHHHLAKNDLALVYFERSLQNKVICIFRESLRPIGFLCLGTQATLSLLECGQDFELIVDKERIYRYKQREYQHGYSPHV